MKPLSPAGAAGSVRSFALFALFGLVAACDDTPQYVVPDGGATSDISGDWHMLRYHYTAPGNEVPLPADLSDTSFTQQGTTFSQTLGPDFDVPGTVDGSTYTQTDGSFTATIELDGDRASGAFVEGDFTFSFELVRAADPAFDIDGTWDADLGGGRTEPVGIDLDGSSVAIDVAGDRFEGVYAGDTALLVDVDQPATGSTGAVLDVASDADATLTLYAAEWQLEGEGHTGFASGSRAVPLTRRSVADPDPDPDAGRDGGTDTDTGRTDTGDPDTGLDVIEDVEPDVIEPEVCVAPIGVGQIDGSTEEGAANGGTPQFEGWDGGFDTGIVDMLLTALDESAETPLEGRWDVTGAVVTATGYRSGRIDRAQTQFWLQDGRAAIAVFFTEDDADSVAPFAIQVGQRVSFTATRLDLFRGQVQIRAVDPDSWSLDEATGDVAVLDGSLFVDSPGEMVRVAGRLDEVLIEDCGGGAVCYRMRLGTGGTTKLRTGEDDIELGDCVTFIGPVTLDPDGIVQLDAINFDWTEVTCDGIGDLGRLDTPCQTVCDPFEDASVCDAFDDGPGVCVLDGRGFRCEPGGDGVLGTFCEQNDECSNGLVCSYGECVPYCDVAAPDCPSGRSCVDESGIGVGTCMRTCDGFDGFGDCGVGFACRPTFDGATSPGICGRTDGVADGEPCPLGVISCDEGLLCVSEGGEDTPICRAVCNRAADDPHALCGADGACLGVDETIGACYPGCELGAVRNACIDIEGSETCLPVDDARGACVARGSTPTGETCDGTRNFGECTGVCLPESDDVSTCRDLCRTFAREGGYPSGCGDDACRLIAPTWGVCEPWADDDRTGVLEPCPTPGAVCDVGAQCYTIDAVGNNLCLKFCRLEGGDGDCDGYDRPMYCDRILASVALGLCLPEP